MKFATTIFIFCIFLFPDYVLSQKKDNEIVNPKSSNTSEKSKDAGTEAKIGDTDLENKNTISNNITFLNAAQF